MKNTKLILLGLVILIVQTLHAAPPFSGTIFIDPDIITAADATTFTTMSYAGRGVRTMFDRRINNFTNYNAYLFIASFNDGLTVEIQVNPEFGDVPSATFEANKYATVVGRLPTVLRSGVHTFWIHQGVQPFGGGNNNLLIHTGQSTLYENDGILEETFVHEAGHSSLDGPHAAATGWIAAQNNDPEFISTYARDNPTREDVAESILTWLAVRVRSDRISASLSNPIVAAIPNRLAYFDQQHFDLYPLVPRSVIEDTVPGNPITATSTNSPPSQTAANSIDNEVTTKYLNFDKLNAGLTVTPSGNRPVRALTLISADDAPERDPSSFVLEGSNNGTNFTRIASNAVPAFPARHYIRSFALAGTNQFNVYRVLFPTVANAGTANSMQIAEVELLYHEEITSSSDAVSITLPPGGVDIRGVGALFDRQLDGTHKLEVAPLTNSNTVVNLIPAAGPTILKGFELIGAADDFAFPQRRPSSVSVAGSNDGLNYTPLAAMTPAAPAFNLQIQEFAISNTTAFARYRITFGPPVSGDRLQVGEMRLFGTGIPPVPEIAIFTGNTTNAAAARTNNVGTFTFANTPVDASIPTFFTIKNVGTANLTGLALSESGANPGDFRAGGLPGSSLAPNASTTFWVAFEPSIAGTRTAVIQIASNDGDENPFRINVSGVGTSTAITQQPSHTAACVGGLASFSVGTSSPGLTYQWQKRPTGSATFTNISGATATTYTTPPVTGADDGAGFRVVVSDNAYNVTSSEALLSVVTLATPTASYNFTGGDLGGGNIYGDAGAANNALVLTPAAGGKDGAFLTPLLGAGERVQGFTARFKVQITGGNGYADGFSLNWATDLPNGIFPEAEEGAGGGLRVCFDIFRNVNEPALSIDAKWGTNVIGSYQTDNNFLPGTNDFAEVTIRLHSDGTLDVTYRCVPIFARLPIPGYTPLVGARFGLAARTGGFFAMHTIDDLAIELDSLAPILDASIPEDPVVGTSANSPASQTASKAIDNNVTNKYLNLDKLNTGLIITPTGKQPVRALTLISAEDAPERDPSSFVLEGSNDGTNFARIASNAVPVFPTRHFIRSLAVANTNVFNHYRLLFPTVANAGAANSMQIAEVELLYHEEITSNSDAVSITLPPGAADVRGVGSLFDRQLDGTHKLEVAPLTNSNTVVNLIPAAGPTILKGFELIGAADDFAFPHRRPSSVSVAGSNDGLNYTPLATMTPAAPASNLQIQEFAMSNTTAFARYRITFGPPVGGDRLQVGEMRLFGEVIEVTHPPALGIRAEGGNVLLSWPNSPGYTLERQTDLNGTNWTASGVAPVLTNGINTVTLIRNENAVYFRLRK